MISYYLELIAYKIYAELKAEASRYFLGFAWWIIEPLLYLAAFYSVFHYGLRAGDDSFLAFLLVGLVAWKWFASGVSFSTTAVNQSQGLVNTVYMPKLLFPMFTMGLATVRFGVTLPLLLAALALLGDLNFSHLYWLPALLVLQLLLVAACAILVSVLVPLVPDLRPIIENGLIVGMLVSGIFFDIATFPAEVQTYFYVNPMAVLISSYRDVMINGSAPPLSGLILVFVMSLVVAFAGIGLHRRYDRILPKMLL